MRTLPMIISTGIALLPAPLLANQTVINNLNQRILGPSTPIDYAIQDVCVDAVDQPVAGDPTVCATHRNVRIGEKVPYIVTDTQEGISPLVRYQGNFSYPVPGTDGSLRVVVSKQFGDLNAGFSFAFDEQQDGYDLIDLEGSHMSAIRTYDPGCFDQKISQDVNTRRNGWIFMPIAGPGSGGASNHNIRIDRLNPPVGCAAVSQDLSSSTRDIWNPPSPTTFENGKQLQAIATYHFAHQDLGRTENALERFFFTREYGYSRWEAWVPLARCQAENGASSIVCQPNDPANILYGRCPPSNIPAVETWGNQQWVRVDCRDTTSYLALTTPTLPIASNVARTNGLLDIDVVSVENVYERIFRGNQDFQHAVGSASGVEWSAGVGQTGHMLFGPYVTDLPDANLAAVFRVSADAPQPTVTNSLNLDVFDATSGEVLGSRVVTSRNLFANGQPRDFSINFSLANRTNHAIEFRVWTYGADAVKVNRVFVQNR